MKSDTKNRTYRINLVKYLCQNTTRRFCMSHTHSTTKRRTFKHLNAYQRGQIEAMPRIPKVKIAKGLGVTRSTLYAEIKRGAARQMRSDRTYYDHIKLNTQLRTSKHLLFLENKCCALLAHAHKDASYYAFTHTILSSTSISSPV